MLGSFALPTALFEQIVSWRRHLHAHPELSGEEKETANFVADKLKSFGLEVQTGVGGYGVVGLLSGLEPNSRCVALRADMDALPIEEKNICEYASMNRGVMHACGHDFHTANLLGVASLLSQKRTEWKGTIKFIFQPSEERVPSGAKAMIDEGVLSIPPLPSAIAGLHVSPEIETGKIGYCPGAFMASSDEIYITIIGKGGHAAMAEKLVNPLFVAADVLASLKNITDLSVPILLNFGKIEGKGATNIVPDKVEIAGTLRCFKETLRFEVQKKIFSVVENVTSSNGAQAMVNIKQGYPVLINDEILTHNSIQLISKFIGGDCIIKVPPRMGSEDFAYYSHHIPAFFMRIGTGNNHKKTNYALHTPTFDVDEDAFYISVPALACWAAFIEI